MQVLYDDTPVPKSPFRVSVSEGCDPSRVVATGPGLQQGLTDKPNNFNIITRYGWRVVRRRERTVWSVCFYQILIHTNQLS